MENKTGFYIKAVDHNKAVQILDENQLVKQAVHQQIKITADDHFIRKSAVVTPEVRQAQLDLQAAINYGLTQVSKGNDYQPTKYAEAYKAYIGLVLNESNEYLLTQGEIFIRVKAFVKEALEDYISNFNLPDESIGILREIFVFN